MVVSLKKEGGSLAAGTYFNLKRQGPATCGPSVCYLMFRHWRSPAHYGGVWRTPLYHQGPGGPLP